MGHEAPDAVKIGLNLINFGERASPESILAAATLAESLGYHLVMLSDHVAVTPDVAVRYPTPYYDPFTTLGWLAAQTRRVELGTTVVILAYRHPLETARMATGIDRLSGGRFVLGIGTGWARQEFEALGVPFERRGAITDECLGAIHAFWAGEVASFRGRFISFSDVHTSPPPLRRPHPPIWVGGATDAALARAVRHGDAWHPIRARVDWIRDDGLPRLTRIAEAAGKACPALCPRIRLRLTDSKLDDATRFAGEGTLDQVRGDLAGFEALGAAYVLLDPVSDDPAVAQDHARTARTLETLAGRVLDLERETVR